MHYPISLTSPSANMPKAMILAQPGGPEQLQWKDIPMPIPGPGEVRVRHIAVGLNFIDVYHRSGFYKLPQYPAIIGQEAAGMVDAVGPDCVALQPGDRVAYGLGPPGAYAQYRTIAEMKLVKLPDAIAPEVAASILLKGMTAHFLVRHTFIVDPSHTILVHAAAGGVGLLLCQWAKLLGARVIGTVGSEAKAELAAANGCDHPILYKKEDVAARVRELTDGRGVNAVYDAVGKDTFQISLDCLMKLGIFISYGQSSGPVPPIEASELQRRGSLFFTRPSLMDYKADPAEYHATAQDLFEALATQKLRVNVGQSYYLSDAAHAHRDLEAGATIGSTILIVD